MNKSNRLTIEVNDNFQPNLNRSVIWIRCFGNKASLMSEQVLALKDIYAFDCEIVRLSSVSRFVWFGLIFLDKDATVAERFVLAVQDTFKEYIEKA